MNTVNSPSSTTHLEIERKFILLPGIEERIALDALPTTVLPTSSFSSTSSSSVTKHALLDIYYDTPFPDIRLSRQDAWLRRRNTEWELKWPSVSLQDRLRRQQQRRQEQLESPSDNNNNSILPSIDHYLEYTDLSLIAEKLQCSKPFEGVSYATYLKDIVPTFSPSEITSTTSSTSTPVPTDPEQSYRLYLANTFEQYLLEQGFRVILRVQTNRRTYALPLSLVSSSSSSHSQTIEPHNSSSSSSSSSTTRITSIHVDIDEVIYPDHADESDTNSNKYSLAEIEVMITTDNTLTNTTGNSGDRNSRSTIPMNPSPTLSSIAEETILSISQYYGFINPDNTTPLGKVLEYIRRYQPVMYNEMIRIGLVDLKTH